LLTLYRKEQLRPTQYPPQVGSRQSVLSELRTILPDNPAYWRAIVNPNWLRGGARKVLVFSAVCLLISQVLFASLVMFIAHLERTTAASGGDPLREKQSLLAATANIAAWSVLTFELCAIFLRDARELRLTTRPVSPGHIWCDRQLSGLKAIPTQVLFACPFLILPGFFGSEWLNHGIINCLVALQACFALRTTICAGCCSFSAGETLRCLVAYPLLVLGWFLAFGLLALGIESLRSRGAEFVAMQLLLQLTTLFVFGLSWGMWILLSRPRRFLKHVW
jgi:hypothetical protein